MKQNAVLWLAKSVAGTSLSPESGSRASNCQEHSPALTPAQVNRRKGYARSVLPRTATLTFVVPCWKHLSR